jgi:hypothetical protein
MERNDFTDIELNKSKFGKFFISFFGSYFPRHTAVFGKSGSGKTRANLALLKSIQERERGIPCIAQREPRSISKVIKANPSTIIAFPASNDKDMKKPNK